MAAARLHLNSTRGWSYVQQAADKYIYAPNSTGECDGTAGQDSGCWVTFALPRVSSSRQAVQQPSEVSALFVRSWRNMSDCWAWLYCSDQPAYHSTPVTLHGPWKSPTTQTSAQLVYPSALWKSASEEVLLGQPPLLSTVLLSLGQSTWQTVDVNDVPCQLDRLILWHANEGQFYLAGYMVA